MKEINIFFNVASGFCVLCIVLQNTVAIAKDVALLWLIVCVSRICCFLFLFICWCFFLFRSISVHSFLFRTHLGDYYLVAVVVFCKIVPWTFHFSVCFCLKMFLISNMKKETVSALFPHKKVSCSWDGVKSRCVLFLYFSLSSPYEYNNSSKTKMLIWHFLKKNWNTSFYVICGYIYLNNTYPRICYLFVLVQWTSLRLTRHSLLHYNNCYFAVTKQFQMIDKTFKLSSVYFEI